MADAGRKSSTTTKIKVQLLQAESAKGDQEIRVRIFDPEYIESKEAEKFEKLALNIRSNLTLRLSYIIENCLTPLALAAYLQEAMPQNDANEIPSPTSSPGAYKKWNEFIDIISKTAHEEGLIPSPNSLRKDIRRAKTF